VVSVRGSSVPTLSAFAFLKHRPAPVNSTYLVSWPATATQIERDKRCEVIADERRAGL
jgi:hypothetical protein